MNWFYDLKLKKKLLGSFFLMALISGVIGLAGYSGLTTVSENSESLYNNRVIPITQLGTASESFLLVRVNLLYAMVSTEKTRVQDYLIKSKKEAQIVDNIFEKYQKADLTKEELETVPLFLSSWNNYKAQGDILSDAILKNDNQVILKTRAVAASFYNEAHIHLKKMVR